MISESNYQNLLKDLERATIYIKNGEESKGRVLARQIAGRTIRVILGEIDSQKFTKLNPFQCLEEALKMPEIFEPIYTDLEALTKKVNYDYSFPQELNLINSTKKILKFVKQYKTKNG